MISFMGILHTGQFFNPFTHLAQDTMCLQGYNKMSLSAAQHMQHKLVSFCGSLRRLLLWLSH